MLVLGMIIAVLVAVAAEVGTIKNDLAQAQPRRFPKWESCERSRTVMGFEKKFSQIGVRIPAFKLELEMKISAFESSFLNEEEAKWASAIGGGMLLFLFYCGWVSEKISFRKTCKASERLVMHRKWPIMHQKGSIKLQEWPVCIIQFCLLAEPYGISF